MQRLAQIYSPILGSGQMTTVPFRMGSNALGITSVNLGRLRLAEMTPEFRRVDPKGELATRIVQALNDVPGLADAIKEATFNDDASGEPRPAGRVAP